jgi:hypothetical protein
MRRTLPGSYSGEARSMLRFANHEPRSGACAGLCPAHGGKTAMMSLFVMDCFLSLDNFFFQLVGVFILEEIFCDFVKEVLYYKN